MDADFGAFYKEFTDKLVGFLIWQGAQLRDAAEIAQETMAALYQSWDRVNHREAWARRVASRSYQRRSATNKEDPTDQIPETASPLLHAGIDPDEFVERHEVLRLLARLPPRQRQIMAWTYDGCSPVEIAEELKMTPDAVRASLCKARRALARHLATTKNEEGETR